MQFYRRFGLTQITLVEYERYEWRLNGEHFFETSFINPPQLADYMHGRPELSKIIAPAADQLAEIGFIKDTHEHFADDIIIIGYSTPHSDYSAGIVIVSSSDSARDAAIRLEDAVVLIRVYCPNGIGLDEFKNTHAEYITKMQELNRQRQEYIAVVTALLPQPIAEEIAAEFSLY